MVAKNPGVSENVWSAFSDNFKQIVADAKQIHDWEAERELPIIPLHRRQYFGILETMCGVPLVTGMEFWDGRSQAFHSFLPGRKPCRPCGARNY